MYLRRAAPSTGAKEGPPGRGRGGPNPPKQRLEGMVHDGVREFCNSVMIPPLVHQRRPCYDFYFL